MREANWDEIFQKRHEDAPPAEGRIAAFLPWEDWLTFAIVAVGFMSVVYSIDSANWVDEMPSLYPIGFSGLLIGYALSRVKLSEALLHPVAILTGATLVFLQLLAILPGGTPSARVDGMLDRMHAWWSAATSGGISDDPLPFIVLILTLVWFGAYVSSWAIFRWRNPWLGLVPGGTALMWNISFIPGQFSYSFVVFIFAAVLLLMRVHVANREADWERRGVVYPEFLSLSVLNATFWVTMLLLIAVWIVPMAERSDSANERWSNFTAPLTERFAPLGRVFVGVNAKKPISVHNLDDALALQGKVTLSSRDAVEINVELTPEMAAFLRGQSFDEYTPDGWKVNVEGEVPVEPGERTDVTSENTVGRQDVTVSVTVQGNNDDFLYSVGQPLTSSEAAEAEVGGESADVSGLRPSGRLGEGDTYSVTGSVSLATVDQLRAAGTNYPQWVTDRYLQLPDDLPARVDRKAIEVTRGSDTPYDQARALEQYLRTFPEDFDIPSTPPGRDSVDYFLFDVQRGYFDYHASAMAVMLRTLGVPSRVAIGYAIDPALRQPDSTIYGLTEKTAFAWPEVYFPDVGWVEFNPTPSRPAIRRPGEPLPSGGARDDFIDRDQIGGDGFDIGLDDPVPGEDAAAPAVTEDDGGSSAWRALITLAIIGAVAALILGGARFAWEFGLGGLTRPAQLWEKTQRLARWGKAGASVAETPREFAARLRRDVPGAEDASVLAAAYERNRFGQKDLSEDESEQLDAAWISVRNTLLRRALRLRPRGQAR